MSRSGCCCCAISSASCPSRAVSTLNPALRSFNDTTWRMWLSSSATRIVFWFMVPALPKRASFRQVQFEPERAALALRALDEDPPVVDGLDNVFDQRQPQPGALGHAAVGF